MDSTLINSSSSPFPLFSLGLRLLMHPPRSLLIQLLILRLDLVLPILSIPTTTSAINNQSANEQEPYTKRNEGSENAREFNTDLPRQGDPVVEHGMVEELQTCLHVVVAVEF